MRRELLFLTVLLLSSPVVRASEFDSESSQSDYGARLSANVERKTLSKRMTVSLSDEARFYESFSKLTRNYTSVGLDYKLNNWIKIGGAYSLIAIAPDSSDPYWTVRHRFQGILTGSYKIGAFKTSLRETIQMTRRGDDINLFQQPRNSWALRSRLKASYEVLGTPLTPFLSIELLHALNAVDYASLDGNVKGATTNSVVYGDVFLRRTRIQIGTEYYFNKHNTVDFYFMCDLESDRDVDATRYGVPKSYDLVHSRTFTVGIDYNFAWKR